MVWFPRLVVLLPVGLGTVWVVLALFGGGCARQHLAAEQRQADPPSEAVASLGRSLVRLDGAARAYHADTGRWPASGADLTGAYAHLLHPVPPRVDLRTFHFYPQEGGDLVIALGIRPERPRPTEATSYVSVRDGDVTLLGPSDVAVGGR